ncbi:GNAT family N-acetyltransferase [Luteolibacter flavescens]|uniref:GNAT family N-acetyltransferase n=2 Tax=Luteolibacter flavescens TaxID=1859460 RepID=A0ABT3FR27_9BACT|nr:GNAT family N-acetyltransferase [Luteolibacter flavescens]
MSGQSPYHHFRIFAGARDVGHINLRIGDSRHVRRVVGHVGYWIRRRARGNGYALSACHALAPFARAILPKVILTCDPDNTASRRTLERLVPDDQVSEIRIPPKDPHYSRGVRKKLRFIWMP